MRRSLPVAIVLWALPVLALAQVPYERLLTASDEPHNWLTYSGNYRSERFSGLDELTPDNVARLRPRWVYQGASGQMEATPLVVDNVMYVTEPPSTVTALDTHSGRQLWSWTPVIAADVRVIGFPPVNRGVALIDDTVVVGTIDGRLVGLDARSGAVRWETMVAENDTGHSVTAAPLAVDGKLLVGISGGEAGIRGFLDSYDANTGSRLWRT